MTRNQTQRSLDIHVKVVDGQLISVHEGPLLATGYTRLVIGGRGEYIEIHPSQLIREEIEVEPGEEYRLNGEWREKAFYAWYRTKVAHRKVYEQYRHVGYADYVPGYFYVSPLDVIFRGKLYSEEFRRASKKEALPQIDFGEEGQP